MLPVLLGTFLQLIPAEGIDCAELGFDSGLECGTCKELNEFGLKEIEADCLKCCRKSEEEATTYQSGVLEVCSWKIGRFPQVAAFIEEKSKQLKNFKVEYVRGAPPRIKLYGASGNVEDEVGIEKWDTDTIVQFLDEKIAH